MLVRGTPPIFGAGPSIRIGMLTTVVSTAVIFMSPPATPTASAAASLAGPSYRARSQLAILAADTITRRPGIGEVTSLRN